MNKKNSIGALIVGAIILLALAVFGVRLLIDQNPISPSIQPHNPEQARSSETQSVINELIAIRDTDDFQKASDEEKEQMLIDALEKISESGTEEYPYSIIDPDSIYSTYHSVYFTVIDGTEQSFSFS